MKILNKGAKIDERLRLAIVALIGVAIGLLAGYLVMVSRTSSVMQANSELHRLVSEQAKQIAILRTTTAPQLLQRPMAVAPRAEQPPQPPALDAVAPDASKASGSQDQDKVEPKPAAPKAPEPTVSRAAPPPAPPKAAPTAPPKTAQTTKPSPPARAADKAERDAPRVESRTASSQRASEPIPVATSPVAAAPVAAESTLPNAAAKAVIKATLSQANITGLDSASVTFKTGLRVQVGSSFPSGEKLLSASPSERKIETDRRIILLQIEPTPSQPNTSPAE